MKKVYKLTFIEVLPSIASSFFVIFFFVFVIQFNKFSKLLLSTSFTLTDLFKLVLFLMPNVLFISLPVSLLIGIVIGIGNLSGENGITALNSSGISSLILLKPLLIISLFIYILTSITTFFIAPYSNRKLRELKYTIGITHFISEIEPRTFITSIPNVVIYIEDISSKDKSWHNIIFFDERDPNIKKIYTAKVGKVFFDRKKVLYQVILKNGTLYKVDKKKPSNEGIVNFKETIFPLIKVDLEAFRKLPLRRAEKTMGQLLYDLNHLKKDFKDDKYVDSSIEFYQRISLPFVAILFGFLGLPLGVSRKKGKKSYGYMISITIVVLYYLSFVYSWKFGVTHNLYSPAIGVWIPLLFFSIITFLLLRRLSMGKNPIPSIEKVRLLILKIFRTKKFPPKLKDDRSLKKNKSLKREILHYKKTFFLKKLDIYSTKSFFKILLILLFSLSALFIIFTLFELIDEIYKNKIPPRIVAEYFLNFLPYLVHILLPLMVLVASSIFIHLMEKNREILALKSCGISVYRLMTVILISSLVVAFFSFLSQELLIPKTNRKQELLLARIKGKSLLRKTSGGFFYKDSSSIISYDMLDIRKKKFINFKIYKFKNNKLWEKICSKYAYYNPQNMEMKLIDVVYRRYSPTKRFFKIKEKKLPFPSFKNILEIHEKKISEMTFIQLKKYIDYIKSRGFDTLTLKIKYEQKFSYPLMNFTMIFIGIPLILIYTGKRTYIGFMIALVLGISFRLLFPLFISLGITGFFPIFFSVWGPHLIFISIGIYFLTEVKT